MTTLTIEAIDQAMKGNTWWTRPKSEEAKIVLEAVTLGYVKRLSHTQVQWTEEGLAKAKRELSPKESTPAPLASNELGRFLARQWRLARTDAARAGLVGVIANLTAPASYVAIAVATLCDSLDAGQRADFLAELRKIGEAP